MICTGKMPKLPAADVLALAPPSFVELMQTCLVLEPKQRASAETLREKLVAVRKSSTPLSPKPKQEQSSDASSPPVQKPHSIAVSGYLHFKPSFTLGCFQSILSLSLLSKCMKLPLPLSLFQRRVPLCLMMMMVMVTCLELSLSPKQHRL